MTADQRSIKCPLTRPHRKTTRSPWLHLTPHNIGPIIIKFVHQNPPEKTDYCTSTYY